jgi:ribosomal protein S1
MHDLVPGQLVAAEVEAVAVFGLFCRAAGHRLLVRITEASWIAAFSSGQQFAAPGDRFAVKLTDIDQSGRIYASIRQRHPDPWAAGWLTAGAVLQARVVRAVPAADRCAGQPGYVLEVLPGAYAMLCADDLALRPGQEIQVRIISADPGRRSVKLEALAYDSA